MNKKFLSTILLTSAILLTPSIANAESGNVTINVNSNDYVGDKVTLTVSVNNIDSDGLAAVGGDVVYDSNILKLDNYKSSDVKYSFFDNKLDQNTVRIAEIDLSGENLLKNNTILYTFTFDTLKEGETTVKFENCELVNFYSQDIDCNTNNKVLIINSKKDEVKVDVPASKEVKDNTNISVRKTDVSTNKVNNDVKEEVKDRKEESKNEITTNDNVNDNNKEIKLEKKDTKKVSKSTSKSLIKTIKIFISSLFGKLFK